MTPTEAETACRYLAGLFPTAAPERCAALSPRLLCHDAAAVRLCMDAHRATHDFLTEPALLATIREQARADANTRRDAVRREADLHADRARADRQAADADRDRVRLTLAGMDPAEVEARKRAVLEGLERDGWPASMVARFRRADPLESPTLGVWIVGLTACRSPAEAQPKAAGRAGEP